MPFSGRPSPSCLGCRERRIKQCDRVRPACSQCRRVGRSCTGYRDVDALIFRDENARTRRRALKPLRDQDASAGGGREVALLRADSDMRLLSPVEDQALRFFFTHFASIRSEHVHSSLFFSGLADNPSLHDAVLSVGLAAMANVTGEKAAMTLAQHKYASSVGVVRRAVQDPTKASPHQTIQIILMLSLFEMVSCPEHAIDAWAVHLDGVAALFAQTGFGWSFRQTEYKIQLQFCYLLILKYFLVGGPLPVQLLIWGPRVISLASAQELPAARLLDIFLRFARLYSLLGDTAVEKRAVVDRAIALDAELEVWESSLPPEWSFTLQQSMDRAHTYEGTYHLYHDMWAARILNHYRWGRLLVNEIILAYTTVTIASSATRHRALETIRRMAVDLCAGAATQMKHVDVDCSIRPPAIGMREPPLSGVFMLIFQLAVAGRASGVPQTLRAWVRALLDRLGYSLGIRRALEVFPAGSSSILRPLQRPGQETTEWRWNGK
ncbi:hypothetical protein ASPZODRAFT_1311720 [Penicilliopsis zonata CBS 506.65]|uniref:Zn(2)-C6 fungal-type domain-containing protein n=1 Tax=Penicilliopsis zonata CBS 506.65 TaxID=1073090 RepID=A0A1L9S5N3_9EURO|nr:hypothetical protein ASPZODRAFT_1311720 [Penicilliopsis zonata CBS 506.65]OJJ42449.1 hypothetical protein ASPZODRAFT_1311720 [Penicilliopsis zonata CBS 506.65]